MAMNCSVFGLIGTTTRTPPPPPPPPAPTPEDGLAAHPQRAPGGDPPPPSHPRGPHPHLRRLVVNRAFLRRFRKLHPPPLLGFVNYKGFRPALPPHPSAPAASAADFDFAFLPAPAFDWSVREVCDGRVLLDRPSRHAGDGLGSVFKEMVACDPLHRQYLLLPPLPDDLAASIVVALAIEGPCFGESFLAPPRDDEEAAAITEETSFRVIWMLLLQTKPMAAVFSSGTGQWQALSRSEPLPGFLLSTWKFWFVSRHYAHGCFYWVSGTSEKLLVLDIRKMEFSMVDHPPCARYSGDDAAIVEAGQGITLMFVPKPDTSRLIYTVWRNNGGSSTQWQMENEPFSLDSGSVIKGAVGRHLLLYYGGSSSVERGCYTRDVDTLQLERVCGSYPDPSEAYCNFPPSLLSSPTVSSGTRHADAQGAGDDLLVPELREAYPGGVQGPVVAAAAHAPNLLFVIEGTHHADVQVAGEPEVREANPGSMQGPFVAAAARAPNPLFVIEGTRHADIHGVGDDVMVPELREADPGSVQGPVVAATAKAPSPLFVVEGTPHADVVLGAGVDVPLPELREADPEGVQGPLVAAVAQAPNPLLVVDDDAEAGHGGARGEGGAEVGAGAGPAEVAEPGRRGGEGSVRGGEGQEYVVRW
ncbi:uncharacterized protein LOC119361440 [Triticum dicoccoides]|uniref:uncharacterized protein LOC119361440 n=1 Tax=Triticum dicoccoides TaxID=85692 RepID=UPI00188E6CEC|nr:uncharacterized protein LOC119361440 [Triticum dicoccoides]